jgi:transcriptional regulator GlxA family with amidase domain
MDLMHAIRSFDKESKHPDSLPLMLDCLSVQIAALLLREFRTNHRKFSAAPPDGRNYVNLAVEYMQTFFSSNIDIDDICREINVSPFHFIRTFKQKTGYSPHQFLLNVRIKKAEELLRTGQYSVSETAMLCGFVSLPHFSNTFKRLTGYSPKAYCKFYSFD